MVQRWLVLGVVTLMSCSTSQSKFVPKYTDLYCDYLLECSDPAVLAFDGWTDLEDCSAIVGPVVAEEGAGCNYKGGRGKKCIRAMKKLTCPAEGTHPDDALPPICDPSQIYLECVAVPGDTDEGDDGDTSDTGV